MKIGEGRFYGKPKALYVPKGVVTALDLEDRDVVEFHVEGQAVTMRKAKKT